MSALPSILMLLLGILLVNVLIWGGLIIWLKKRVNKHLQALKIRYPERDVILMAPAGNLIGLESTERKMLRGNCTVILTAKELVVSLWLPRTDVIIQRRNIKGFEAVDSFAGKKIFKPLLQIRFKEAQGQEAMLALYLPDLDRWQAALKRF